MNSDPNKILIIQTAFIGDVIYTTPLIRAVKENFPKAHLSVIVAPRGELVLANNPHIDELLLFDKQGVDKGLDGLWRWIRFLRNKHFDLVIAPHRSWRSTILSWGSGAKQKVGFRKGLGRWIYSPSMAYSVKKEPRYVERKLNLARALGLTPDSSQVEMFVNQKDRNQVEQILESKKLTNKPLAALNPGSHWETKRWILEYYLELGSRLGRELGFQVILLGSPQEKEMLDWLERRMEPKPLNRTGDSLRMAAAWLEKCEVYVGGDTGPTYMAVGAGTKHVIALYGPTPENVFDFREGDAVIFKDGLRCRPCSPHGPRVCPIGTLECQTGIWAGKVFEQIVSKLEENMTREKTEYTLLLDGLIAVIEANKGADTGEGYRYLYAEALAAKLFSHCASAYYLYLRTRIPDIQTPKGPLQFLDMPSILVLARSAFETFLVFHSIYVESRNGDEEDFKYWVWRLRELQERQKIQASAKENKKKQEKEKKDIDDISKILNNNKIFMRLESKIQKIILKGEIIGRAGDLNLPGCRWVELAVEAGLDRKYCSDSYRFLCNYAHSGGWSISQMIAGSQGADMPDFTQISLGQLSVFISFMIRAYVKKFPKASGVIQDKRDLREIVEKWLYVGSDGKIENI